MISKRTLPDKRKQEVALISNYTQGVLQVNQIKCNSRCYKLGSNGHKSLSSSGSQTGPEHITPSYGPPGFRVGQDHNITLVTADDH